MGHMSMAACSCYLVCLDKQQNTASSASNHLSAMAACCMLSHHRLDSPSSCLSQRCSWASASIRQVPLAAASTAAKPFDPDPAHP